MSNPEESDYIDIHTHRTIQAPGVFSLENLMAHENRLPDALPGKAFSYGIHPWFLNEENHYQLLSNVIAITGNSSVIAIGEAGFDRIKGPPIAFQRKIFEEQVKIAEDHSLPVIIHCVRAWDELLLAHKKLRPKTPWMVHGFRGNKDLAGQLISKGIYLSFWFDFVIKSESTQLLQNLPANMIFLETDGADIDIKDIYNKVSGDLNITVNELKKTIRANYLNFFS